VINWAEPPALAAVNPLTVSPDPIYWPLVPVQDKQAQLLAAAEMVKLAQETANLAQEETLDAENDYLKVANEIITEALMDRHQHRVISLPATLSVSEVSALGKDPESFAANLYRPMPTAPSGASRRGTAFHEWVEEHFQTSALVEPIDLPGAADESLTTDEAIESVKRGFLRSRWAELSPVELEWDFVLSIGGRAIAGRADAVFLIDGVYTIVDWKTGSSDFVDPVQLSLYRHAWARTHGLAPEAVAAMFVFLPSGEEMTPEKLLSATQVGELLGGTS
jgi:DNA helicase-2/ATP-dependent DNA helicase PcrA